MEVGEGRFGEVGTKEKARIKKKGSKGNISPAGRYPENARYSRRRYEHIYGPYDRFLYPVFVNSVLLCVKVATRIGSRRHRT